MYHTFRSWQALTGAALLAPLPARAQDAAQIEAGMRLYQGNNSCELCHAWSGNGFNHNMLFGPVPAGGPSLVTSKMTRAQMIEMVECGRLTQVSIMPFYRGDAWTREHPCFGKTRAEMPYEEMPVQGERLLSRGEIEAVVAFVQAVYQGTGQGTGMNRAACLKYFSTSPRACDTLVEPAPAAAPAAPAAPTPGFRLPAVPN